MAVFGVENLTKIKMFIAIPSAPWKILGSQWSRDFSRSWLGVSQQVGIFSRIHSISKASKVNSPFGVDIINGNFRILNYNCVPKKGPYFLRRLPFFLGIFPNSPCFSPYLSISTDGWDLPGAVEPRPRGAALSTGPRETMAAAAAQQRGVQAPWCGRNGGRRGGRELSGKNLGEFLGESLGESLGEFLRNGVFFFSRI